jgi:hypothetical protein
MGKINSVVAETIRRLPARMSPEHLVLTMAIFLMGYALCGWLEGNREIGPSRRSLHAWSGILPDTNARVVRLEGDVKRPGIYVLAPGEPMDEVLREAGIQGAFFRSPSKEIASGTVLVIISRKGEAQVAGMRDMPPLEKILLGVPLDLNTIDAETLAHVPGIGPVRAEKIIEERGRRGGFKSLMELESVPGIGPSIRKKVERYLEISHLYYSHPE